MIAQTIVIPAGPPSMTAALADILDQLGIPTRQHCAAIGRAKHLLKDGLLPGYQLGKGKTAPLSTAQYRRLLWAVFITTCDIPPATVVAAFSRLTAADLSGDTIRLPLDSKFHDRNVLVTAVLPRGVL